MELTRRRFFQALAASALAAGVPLPIGFPIDPQQGVAVIYNNYQFLWLVDRRNQLYQAEWTGEYSHTAWVEVDGYVDTHRQGQHILLYENI